MPFGGPSSLLPQPRKRGRRYRRVFLMLTCGRSRKNFAFCVRNRGDVVAFSPGPVKCATSFVSRDYRKFGVYKKSGCADDTRPPKAVVREVRCIFHKKFPFFGLLHFGCPRLSPFFSSRGGRPILKKSQKKGLKKFKKFKNFSMLTNPATLAAIRAWPKKVAEIRCF